MIFVRGVNLSLENAVSDLMYNIIEEAMKLGQSFPNQNLATLFSKISRSTFTKRFISKDNELYDSQFIAYKEIKNIALAIEAVKEGSLF